MNTAIIIIAFATAVSALMFFAIMHVGGKIIDHINYEMHKITIELNKMSDNFKEINNKFETFDESILGTFQEFEKCIKDNDHVKIIQPSGSQFNVKISHIDK